jgi:hypothetical protein
VVAQNKAASGIGNHENSLQRYPGINTHKNAHGGFLNAVLTYPLQHSLSITHHPACSTDHSSLIIS